MTNDMDKLAEAADELIKVVSTASIQENAIAIGNEAVKGLHQLSNQASSVETLLESWRESQDAKTNTMIQSIEEKLTNVKEELANHREILASHSEKLASVEDKLVTLNESIANQTKSQTLEWAISNAPLQSTTFKYVVESDEFTTIGDGKILVRDILLHFRVNRGYDISNYTFSPCNPSYGYYISEEESKVKLREYLSNDIYLLTGQEPRLELEDEDHWFIYYS